MTGHRKPFTISDDLFIKSYTSRYTRIPVHYSLLQIAQSFTIKTHRHFRGTETARMTLTSQLNRQVSGKRFAGGASAKTFQATVIRAMNWSRARVRSRMRLNDRFISADEPFKCDSYKMGCTAQTTINSVFLLCPSS